VAWEFPRPFFWLKNGLDKIALSMLSL